MHTEDFALFNALLEHGSISATARALEIPLPTVSRRLRALEDGLDTRLFKRTSNQLVLTEEGKVFNTHAQQMLASLERMHSDLTLLRQQKGTVTIAGPNGLHLLIGQHLPEFKRLHPEISLNFVTYEGLRASQLVHGEADLVVRIGQPVENAMLCRRLFGLYRSFVASPEFIAQHPELVHPSQLIHYPAVLTDKGGLGLTTWFWCDDDGRHTIQVKGAAGSDIFSLSLLQVEQGHGVGWLPPALLQDSLQAGRTQLLFEGRFGTLFDIFLLFQSRRHLPQRVRKVIDFLARVCEQHDCVHRCDLAGRPGCLQCGSAKSAARTESGAFPLHQVKQSE